MIPTPQSPFNPPPPAIPTGPHLRAQQQREREQREREQRQRDEARRASHRGALIEAERLRREGLQRRLATSNKPMPVQFVQAKQYDRWSGGALAAAWLVLWLQVNLALARSLPRGLGKVLFLASAVAWQAVTLFGTVGLLLTVEGGPSSGPMFWWLLAVLGVLVVLVTWHSRLKQQTRRAFLTASLGGRALRLDDSTDLFTIGREASSDLVATSTLVSRAHGVLEPSASGGWVYTDVGSTHGSFVAGSRVYEIPVTPGLVVDLAGLQGERLYFGTEADDGAN